MAEAAALASAVASHVHATCRALDAADSPERALCLVQHLAAAYLPSLPGQEAGQAVPALRDDADAELAAAAQRLRLAAGVGGTLAVQNAFWAGGFSELAEALLSGVAPKWLQAEPDRPLSSALDAFFLQGPATSALSALLAHLASVQPLETPSRRAAAAATARGALTAARLLTSRFACPGAAGIAQLAAECSQGPGEAAQQAAALLASVPERAAALWQPQLQQEAFVAALVSNLLASCPAAAAVPAAGSVRGGLAGAVLARLARRGCAAQAAAALWAAADPPANGPAVDLSPLGWALACVTDSLAVERLLEALLTTAAGAQAAEQQQLRLLRAALLSAPQLLAAPGLRHTLAEKLLLHRCLPPAALRLLVSLLAALQQPPAAGVSLAGAAAAVAQAWASEEGIARLSLPRHACLTAALLLLLRALGKEGVAAAPGLAAALLAGVGAALDSPLEPIRRQGMRAGNAYAAALGTAELPFDGELGWLSGEAWHPDCAAQGYGLAEAPGSPLQPQAAAAPGEPCEGPAAAAEPATGSRSGGGGATHAGVAVAGAAGAAARGSGGGVGEGADCEAETGTDSDDSLEPCALEGGSSGEEADLQDGRPLQLRALAEQLGKASEPQTVLAALRLAPLLIEAAPDELPSHAGLLARALLFCSVPEWADREAASEAAKPSALRLRALAALLARAPRQGGLTLAGEVYSPHLDLSQRLLVLDTLATAAQQMALPPARRQAPAAAQAALLDPIADAKTRRWGARSLARLRRAQAQPKTFRNSFPAVAVEWTSALLEECGKERHGVDLFGRDALLLARLLLTLGAFVQASAPSVQTAAVAAASLEMLRLAPVHAHAQPLVRRAALLTASQVLRALPPARLAAALADGGPIRHSDGLVERLGWLQGWLLQAAGGDADPEVRALARGCQALQAELASGALASLEAGAIPDGIAGKGPAQLLGLAPGAGPPRLRVQLPELPSPGLPP